MKLLEYQSKSLLGSFGIPFTRSLTASTPEEAAEAFASLGSAAVLKAQVPFGGRGKLGAIRMVNSVDDTRREASDLLAREIRGVPVKLVALEPRIVISREVYLGFTWDLRRRRPVALFNAAGGMDVESATKQTVQRSFDPRRPLAVFEGREIVEESGLVSQDIVRLGSLLAKLSEAFLSLDGLTVEINPLALTEDGEWKGVDAHVELDDDAAGRLRPRLGSLGEIPSIFGRRPPTEFEREASRIDASDHRGVAGRVVEFDGALALLIGGGGASLTVFDSVLRHGGRPANYCEIGGNPTEEKVAALTCLLLSKPGVTHLAVIMNVVNNTRADVMARGVVQGILKSGWKPAEVLSVFRIPGSWEDEASAFLAQHGIKALGREVSLDEAAARAVAHAKR